MKDKVIVITGGTSGIGLSAAEKFLPMGAKVVLVGRNLKKGEVALKKLKTNEDKCIYIAGDVSIKKDCQNIVDKTIDKFGRLDVLVNSAGIYTEGSLEELTESELNSVFGINVKGVFFMCQAALGALRKTKGNIVNISSDAGVKGNYFCTAYSASKGAVTMFTRSLALELAHEGIRVNAVAPGDIYTPMTEAQISNSINRESALDEMASVYPIGRIGTAEEVSAVICFLASEEASFITGAVWSVDGGLTA